jgi:hypothetical protein
LRGGSSDGIGQGSSNKCRHLDREYSQQLNRACNRAGGWSSHLGSGRTCALRARRGLVAVQPKQIDRSTPRQRPCSADHPGRIRPAPSLEESFRPGKTRSKDHSRSLARRPVFRQKARCISIGARGAHWRAGFCCQRSPREPAKPGLEHWHGIGVDARHPAGALGQRCLGGACRRCCHRTPSETLYEIWPQNRSVAGRFGLMIRQPLFGSGTLIAGSLSHG